MRLAPSRSSPEMAAHQALPQEPGICILPSRPVLHAGPRPGIKKEPEKLSGSFPCLGSAAGILSAQGALQGIPVNAQDHQAGILLVLRGDHMPGGIFRAGTQEHLVRGAGVLGPFVTVTPVFIGDLVALPRDGLTLPEAAARI